MKLFALAGCALALLPIQHAQAFSFTPRDFGKLANDRASLSDIPFRMYLSGCQQNEKLGGNVCVYGISKDVTLAVVAQTGSEQASYVILRMAGQKDFAAFGSATGILLSVCSPNTSDEERNGAVHRIVTAIEAQTGSSDPAETVLDGTAYSVVKRPDLGIIIRAQEKSAD